VTPADRKLAALLAAFAPSRAGALASRLRAGSAAELVLLAERLAAAGRRERLAAVAAALAPARPAAGEPRSAAGERPRIGSLLRERARIGFPPAALLRPALARLLRERSAP
jgi:hypothetical protein